MKTALAILAATAFTALSAPVAFADTWLRTGGATSVPAGHHFYCARGGRHCGAHRATGPAQMNRSKWARVQSVNTRVNRAIQPAHDMDVHGEADVWEIPRSVGDCEDYALLKRSKLLRAGFSPSQLPLVKARLPWGEAHVVLVVRTNEGDFVLDNLHNDIRPFHKTGYRFLKMQAPDDSSTWLRVTGRTSNYSI